jgi:hypothetical protein
LAPLLDPGYAGIIIIVVVGRHLAPLLDPGYAGVIVIVAHHSAPPAGTT